MDSIREKITNQDAARFILLINEDSIQQCNWQWAQSSHSVHLDIFMTHEDAILGHDTAAGHATSTFHVAYLYTTDNIHDTSTELYKREQHALY